MEDYFLKNVKMWTLARRLVFCAGVEEEGAVAVVCHLQLL